MVAEIVVNRLATAEAELLELLSLLDSLDEAKGSTLATWTIKPDPEGDDKLRHLADETLPWLIRTVRRLAKTATFLDRLYEAFEEDEASDAP